MPDLAALAAHLHGVLAGRAAGTVYVWSRPPFPPHDERFEVEAVEPAEDGRALRFHFRGAPIAGALLVSEPEGVVLDEHGLRIRSAGRVEWGGLRAERLGAGWVRLEEDGGERTVETARREALQLDPPPGEPSWLEQHGG